MKSLKIILDCQHMGKPHKPADRGAVHTLFQGTGVKFVESDLCLQYATIAYNVLTSLGHHPFLVTHGYYGQRAAFSNKINADLYLACHLNSFAPAPKSNYALVEIVDAAGMQTRYFANYLSQIFGARLPVDSAKVNSLSKDDRGYSCINQVTAPALLLEPCFINHLHSQELLHNNIWQISDAIVYAIKTFSWEGEQFYANLPYNNF